DLPRFLQSHKEQAKSALQWLHTFRSQQISGQESPFFTIPRSFQEKIRKQGQEQNLLQPEEERVIPHDPEAVRFGKRSTQEPEVVVNHSRLSSPHNRNITPTQTEHNIVTSESNINSDTLCLQMSQYSEQSTKKFAKIEAGQKRLRKTHASSEQIVKNLQEGYAQLRKASEETKKRLN
ncbi:hypothetical protein O181_133880, partial [Austropuccinia psidii MF-1]|nr:hypothetical protein [Austropuccinia psidii MF-1]